MVVVLMGVTGSGKTTVGKVLATELGWEFYLCRRLPSTEEHREDAPWHRFDRRRSKTLAPDAC